MGHREVQYADKNDFVVVLFGFHVWATVHAASHIPT